MHEASDKHREVDLYQAALMNILEDVSADKSVMENSQKAMLNILEDVSHDKSMMSKNQKAMLNILEDSVAEKNRLEDTQKAVMNILDDYALELTRVEQMNSQLKEARDSLELRVEERTSALKRSNDELESFSYSVSHDLRAPLRAIAGYSEILQEDYYDNLDDEGREVLDTITRNAAKMATLIDDILAFSRLGRQQRNVQLIDMRELFTQVYQDLLASYRGPAIHFTIGELPPAAGDRSMLSQLASNLLSNAIKYGSATTEPRIEVDSTTDNGQVVYTVRDYGVGFDQKYETKLFGVFQRLHGENEFEGTGVGLAIAQRVVTHHGGKIWAHGAPGAGACFYFTLEDGHERSG